MTHSTAALATQTVPRLGFIGVGWIGRQRMQSLSGSGAGTVHAIADASADRRAEAAEAAPTAFVTASIDELLEQELDGVVIATPSALHADQCVRALERGLAVFCQKPLACTASDTRHVIAAARTADRLLGIDLSYRETSAMHAVREAVVSGAVGAVFAADLTFHNAYGPDRSWAKLPALAGGGCVIDLGTHLVDLALWTLDFPAVRSVASQLFHDGNRLADSAAVCEDYAVATLELESGVTVRIACSWGAHTGRDAVISMMFHGTDGSVEMHNVDGSFHDFQAHMYRGPQVHIMAAGPDAWEGRALIGWSQRLGRGERFDTSVETIVDVATVLDRMLGR